MPKRRFRVPNLCHHKPSGRDVVYIGRTAIYLGPHDSAESREAYGELVAKLNKGIPLEEIRTTNSPPRLKVSDLLLKYINEELPRFHPDEQHCQRGAMRVLVELFGDTPIVGPTPEHSFGPLKLRIVRDAMIAGDPSAVGADGKPRPRRPWSRDYINHQVKRLRAIFRWGVSWEIVPQTVADALAAVSPLKVGESAAQDYAPRRSVSAADIEAVRTLLKPRDRDILDLMLMTGARPGELIGLRIGDVQRTGETWRCELKRHKTRHKGKDRVLLFNRKAQEILLRHIKADPEARFFITTRSTFSNTIKAKCIAAGVAPWVPHQLRHTVATNLADEIGLESAQSLLGHSDAVTTEIYTRNAERKATAAVRRLAGD